MAENPVYLKGLSVASLEELAEKDLIRILSMPVARRSADEKKVLDGYQKKYLSSLATRVFGIGG